MGSRNIIPPGPLIPGSGNYETLYSQILQTGNMTTSTITTESSKLGFFQKSPAEQQNGAPTQNNSGSKATQASDHDMLISINNLLHNYGLAKHAPIFTGRTLTFTNLTTDSPTLELYVTIGGVGNTLKKIHTFNGTGPSSSWTTSIPDIIGWTGNFQVWPVGFLPTDQLGANLFEIAVNEQVVNADGELLPLRDDWDITTVPPYQPVPQLDCGPRDQSVSVAYAPITNYGSGYTPAVGLATTVSPAGGTGLTVDLVSVGPGGSITYPICVAPYNTPGIGGYIISNFGSGYSAGDILTIVQVGGSGGQLTIGPLTKLQCRSYNVGMQVIPPAPPTDTVTYPPLQVPGPYWPPVTTTVNVLDGNSPDAITYPNDTGLPKSQVGYAQGNYIINIIDPTIVVII